MLTVALVAILCLYIVLALGNWVLNITDGLFHEQNTFYFAEQALCGICVLMVWCNVWSLFLPLNAASLIVPLLVSSYRYLTQGKEVYRSLTISRQHLYFAPLIIIFLLYCVVPPYHGDSDGYHFAAI